MAFRTPLPRPRVPARVLIPLVLTLVIVVLLLTVGVSLYTNLLFFRSTGFAHVFSTVLRTRILLFVLVGLVLAVAAGTNAVLAYRLRPPFRPVSQEQRNLDRYRIGIEPYRLAILLGVTTVIGIVAGIAGSRRWQVWQLWRHAQTFGTKDPQFHRDIGYYAFTYPFERFLLSVGFQAVVVSLVVALGVHYLYGGIRLQTPGDKAVPAAKAHISVLLGLFVLLKAFAYYLDRFGLNYSTRGFVSTGASYTDIHVVLPAKTILLAISVICALLFFANARLRGWTLPAVSLGLLLFASVVIGGIVPAIFQAVSVKPNEASKEQKYIQRNIEATQQAYSITPSSKDGKTGSVSYSNYGTGAASTAAVTADTTTVPNARLIDPNVEQPAFEQLEQLKNYYGFTNDLDVDRYTVGGKEQEYTVAAREIQLSGLQSSQQNWINTHLVYTHGQGFVGAPTNTANPENGRPVFDSALENSANVQSRIYFGELSPNYSIVDTKQGEVDGTDSTDTDQLNHYDGGGGVGIGSLFRRVVFAAKFKDTNILLSGSLTSQSKILYDRDPRTRVQKVAPWLTVDTDPYPAVVNGRIVYILDGYTTSDAYPYSARTTLSSATNDSQTATGSQAGQGSQEFNYIRNSVKAVVDAGTGNVTLYAWDATDPILKAWEGVFPGVVKPESAAPAALVAHFRYPEDLFKVQRELLTRYYVTDPETFYQQSNFWSVPNDPTVSDATAPQPPYYVLSQVPGQTSTQFNLVSTLTALRRPNATAYVSVSSGPQDSSDPDSRYGHITVLQLPSEPNGPSQVQSNFNSYTPFSSERTLLDQGGSKVINGNLLALPVGNQLLWVEPIYVTGNGSAIPALRYVLVNFGGSATPGYDVTYPQALTEALASFSSPSGSSTSGSTPSSGSSPTPTPTPSGSASPSSSIPSGDVRQQIQNLLQQQQQIENNLKSILSSLPSPSASSSTSGSAKASASPNPSAASSGGASPSPTKS